jgi:hypothetical protein
LTTLFHSLFPDAELAIVRIPKPPDGAMPEEIAAHQARMRELVKQGMEIDGQRYDLVLVTGARKHGDFLFALTPYWKKIPPNSPWSPPGRRSKPGPAADLAIRRERSGKLFSCFTMPQGGMLTMQKTSLHLDVSKWRLALFQRRWKS